MGNDQSHDSPVIRLLSQSNLLILWAKQQKRPHSRPALLIKTSMLELQMDILKVSQPQQ